MASFIEANRLFNEGKYQEALNLYLKLKDIYGGQIVEFGIKKCQEHLSNQKKHAIRHISIDLDPHIQYNTSNTQKYRVIFSKKYEASNRKDVISLVELAELDLIDNRLKDALHKIKVAITLDGEYRKIYEIGEKVASLQGDSKLSSEYAKIKESLPIIECSEKDLLIKQFEDSGRKNVEILIKIAELDILDGDFKEALEKAKLSISIDKNYRKAYYIGEQAAIELGEFDLANRMYLEQPPVVNPKEPKKRSPSPTLVKNFVLPPLISSGNNYDFILEKSWFVKQYTKKASIVIPVYNRYEILANTLAALTHQTYPKNLMEIIVVDDGSNDKVFDIIKKYETKLNLFYARQADIGFRVAAARNLGLKLSRNDFIIFMDADILPCPTDIEQYMKIFHVSDECVLIGHRRYVDVSNINDDMILKDVSVATNLPDIIPDNDEAGGTSDWRFDVYKKTEFLKKDFYPFTKGAGGNIAFSKKLQQKAGLMDEDFNDWGCEDSEFAYRLYNAGGYFIPLMNIVSLHQEPLTKVKNIDNKSFRKYGHEKTKQLFSSKCPAPTVRKYESGATFEVPKVSIYIPAYNAEKYIIQAIESCLNQNFADLEICICNDGSTDNTLALLEKNYANNPKVRWTTQRNKGIGAATNQAISMCRGMYIAQLDADDMLKPTAVRSCVEALDGDYAIDGVYTDCDYIDGQGQYIRDGWCGGVFDREWMATGMIATHFRMFRKRIWNRIEPCNEQIKNAVDLDLWLKINEKANIKHIHRVEYSYRWHGKNTSIQNRKLQESNHAKVVQDSLVRQGLDKYWKVRPTNNPLNPREFRIESKELNELNLITPNNVVFLIPTCRKYANKMEAVRKTWASRLKSYGFRYLFLIGEPELEFAQVQDDILHVPCRDDYESLLVKLALGYKFIYQHFDCDYVYKIDDDCYPNLDILVRNILPQLRGHQFAGGAVHKKGNSMNNKWHYGKCSSPIFDKPYKYDIAPFDFAKGGYGYFIRRDTLPVVFNMIDIFHQELKDGIYSFEDVRISELMHNKGIAPYIINGYTVARYQERDENTYLVFDISDTLHFNTF